MYFFNFLSDKNAISTRIIFSILFILTVSPFTNSASDFLCCDESYLLTYFCRFGTDAQSFQLLIFKDIFSKVFILNP